MSRLPETAMCQVQLLALLAGPEAEGRVLEDVMGEDVSWGVGPS